MFTTELRAIEFADTNEAAFILGQSASPHPSFQAGTRVVCLDGEAGEVTRVFTGPEGDVIHFALRTRIWLRKCEILVPVEWISGEDRDGIRLGVSRSQLRQQPEYRSDYALATDIHQALWQDRSLRITADGITTTVRDAVVTLSGHSNKAVSARLEDTVRAVPGVISVQNEIVADVPFPYGTAKVLLEAVKD